MENPVIVRNGFGSVDNIHTGHYKGPSYPTVIHENGYTRASVQLIPISFGWDKKISEQTFKELMAYSLDLTEIGDYLIYATSGNKYAFHKDDIQKYGFAHIWDESMDRMDGWIGMKPLIEHVKPDKEIGLFELPEHTPSYSKYSAMTDVRVPIKELVGTVPVNKVGLYVSLIANLEKDLRDLLFTDYLKERPDINPETLVFLEFLLEKGLGPAREIEAIGVRNMDATASLSRWLNTSYLSVSNKFYERALAAARALGLDEREAVQFVKRSRLYHEICHDLIREKLSEKAEEVKVGELLAEFFGSRASLLEGKIAQYYKALAKENKAYAEGWRTGRIKSSAKSLTSRIESLIMQYASEAEKMGLEGKEAKDYVASRLEQEIKDLGESKNPESADTAKDSKYSERAEAEVDGEHSADKTPDETSAGSAESSDAGKGADSAE